ncbi:MAG TPA: glutamate--tRNA ligase [Gemmatimonadales bacterium]|nr:glutamate--tRNA ligase [Gemmatimonadales bacterium]
MTVRVRFAPSPTGYLHVGGARTALFNWLYAKKTGGTFILRIEDTDKERSTETHTQVILDGMKWLGITYDEGPYYQGQYGRRHRADAEALLAQDRAYRCFCTREELDAQRALASKTGSAFRYDGRCGRRTQEDIAAQLAAGKEFSLRLRMPEGEIAWDDAVHGRISFQGHDLDDFIILRSDGTPIYNLAVVSDDIDMRVTHVIRGDDHISNTPKQIAIYRALGKPEPVFAHVPMILGTDGKKLSKRHGATAVGDYQHQGILPLAMRNFLALLGWSPGGDREIMAEEEMISLFSLEGIQKKAAVFDTTKLEWMNGQYLSARPAAELLGPVQLHLAEMGVRTSRDLIPVIDAVKARSRTLVDIASQVAVRVDRSKIVRDAKGEALAQKLGASFATNLRTAQAALEAVEWNPAAIEAALKAVAAQTGTKLGDLMQPIRVALTGGTVSEPVNELLAVTGKEESLARIAAAAGA